MKIFKRAMNKLNTKGFSLVEMICAVAILAVVGLSVSMFITFSTNSYNGATSEVDLQYEAQQAVNQIKNLILDSNTSVKMFKPDDADPYFIVYNLTNGVTAEGADCEAFEILKILYDSANKQLLYGTHTYLVDDVSLRNDVLSSINEGAIVCNSGDVLAKNVTSFDVDTDSLNKNNTLVLKVSFEKKGVTYESNSNVTLRNRITTTTSAMLAYGNLPVERNKRVTLNINQYDSTPINPTLGESGEEKYIYVERPYSPTGFITNTYSFNAVVDAYGVAGDVKWELLNSTALDGDPTHKSTVNEDTGEVKISSLESCHMLTLLVRSKALTDTTDTVNIYVRWISATGIDVTGDSYVEMDASGSKRIFNLAADISYSDSVDKLTDPQKGYTWELYYLDSEGNEVPCDAASGFTYSASESTLGTVTCDSRASGKTFYARVISNCLDENDQVLKVEKDFSVGPLGGSMVEGAPNVEWHTANADVSRNSSFDTSVNVVNINEASFDWSVKYENSPTAWGSDKADMVKGVKSGSVYNLTVSPKLDFDKTYKFKVHLKVTGKSSDGAPVTYEADSPVTYTVNPSVVTLTECATTNLLRNKEYSGFGISVTNFVNPTLEYAIASGVTAADKITINNSNGKLTVAPGCPWDKEYSFKVKAVVKAGGTVVKEVTGTKEYKLPKVEYTVSNLATNQIGSIFNHTNDVTWKMAFTKGIDIAGLQNKLSINVKYEYRPLAIWHEDDTTYSGSSYSYNSSTQVYKCNINRANVRYVSIASVTYSE